MIQGALRTCYWVARRTTQQLNVRLTASSTDRRRSQLGWDIACLGFDDRSEDRWSGPVNRPCGAVQDWEFWNFIFIYLQKVDGVEVVEMVGWVVVGELTTKDKGLARLIREVGSRDDTSQTVLCTCELFIIALT